MKAIIAEDEIHLADDLQRRLRRLWPELEIAAIAHDGEAALLGLGDAGALVETAEPSRCHPHGDQSPNSPASVGQ